jgi:hypothetical protein
MASAETGMGMAAFVVAGSGKQQKLSQDPTDLAA